MKILVVEDEKYIAKPLEQLLKRNHYTVDLAFDGEVGLDLGLTGLYDVIILDIMLPILDGYQVLQQLRKGSITTPILMLTSKGQIEDKVKGLDSGADDYLPKPFDPQELLARLRALVRRQGELHPGGILKVGNIELNPHTLQLNTLKLTLKETQLLELFIQQKGTIMPKNLIIEKLWSYTSEVDYSHVEYHVSLLRKKLRQVNADVFIQTVRGVGYVLRVEDDAE